jgi:hypothetical protein
MSYHAVYHDLHETYPGTEDVINGVGGTVSVHGTVVATSQDNFTLQLTHGSASKIITIISPVLVARGDKVEVLGVRNSAELVPETMIVSRQWSHYAVYIRSVAGLAITFVVFFRYWTFDSRALQFSLKRTIKIGKKEREN